MRWYDENDALEALQQFQSAHPDLKYDIEEYTYVPPEGRGVGRDPELH